MVHNAGSTRDTSDELSLSYPFDGLIDLFMGLGLLLAGLFIWAGMFWLAGIFPAIFLPIWQSAKKQITAPRISTLRVDPRQRRRLIRAGFLWLGILVLLAVIGLLSASVFQESLLSNTWRTWLGEYLPLLMGAGGALVVGLTALVARVPHWILNAAAILALSAVGFWQGWAGWLVFSLIGGVFLLTGSVLLVQFLRENPLPAAQA